MEPSNDAMLFSGGGSVFGRFKGDEILDPAHDLTPQDGSPDRTVNGRAWLYDHWDDASQLPIPALQRWVKMAVGEVSWDDAVPGILAEHAEALRRDIREALTRPQWVQPCFLDPEDYDLVFAVRCQAHEILAAACLAWSGSRFTEALEDFQLLFALSQHWVASSALVLDVCYQGAFAARLCATVSALICQHGPVPEEILRRIQDMLMAAETTTDILHAAACRDFLLLKKGLLNGSLVTKEFADRMKMKFALRENQTANALTVLLREMRHRWLEPGPSLMGTPPFCLVGRIPDPKGKQKLMDPNATGWRFLREHTEATLGPFSLAARYSESFRRLAVIRVALARWQAAHGGRVPQLLEELVPVYLSAVPADPWHGQAICWEAERGLLLTAGREWSGTLEALHNAPNSGPVVLDERCPGFRIFRKPG